MDADQHNNNALVFVLYVLSSSFSKAQKEPIFHLIYKVASARHCCYLSLLRKLIFFLF